MTKQEILKAIENGDRVWVLDKDENEIEELYFYKNNIYEFDKNDLFINKFWIYEFRNLFKTKAEAEHYLHHANVTRTETLPFLTWEEFKEGKELRFYNGKYTYKMNWVVNPEIIVIKRYLDFDIDEFIFNERLTEANFYKAYGVCVKLFRGKAND